jgi:hypothetical protein
VLRPLRLGTDPGQGATSSRHQRTGACVVCRVSCVVCRVSCACRAIDQWGVVQRW